MCNQLHWLLTRVSPRPVTLGPYVGLTAPNHQLGADGAPAVVARTAHCVDGRDIALFDKALEVRRKHQQAHAQLAARPSEGETRQADTDGAVKMDERPG